MRSKRHEGWGEAVVQKTREVKEEDTEFAHFNCWDSIGSG